MDRILSSAALTKVGETVRLAGWVHNVRTFREIRFLILRDAGGLIQTVATPDSGLDVDALSKESVVELEGEVIGDERAPGGAEVRLTSLKLLAPAVEPPLEINRPAIMVSSPAFGVLECTMVKRCRRR